MLILSRTFDFLAGSPWISRGNVFQSFGTIFEYRDVPKSRVLTFADAFSLLMHDDEIKSFVDVLFFSVEIARLHPNG